MCLGQFRNALFLTTHETSVLYIPPKEHYSSYLEAFGNQSNTKSFSCQIANYNFILDDVEIWPPKWCSFTAKVSYLNGEVYRGMNNDKWGG